LGALVEPEVNRNLATVSPWTCAWAASTAAWPPWPAARQSFAWRAKGQFALAQHHGHIGRHGLGDGVLKGGAVAA
jgi:hypothetical protein